MFTSNDLEFMAIIAIRNYLNKDFSEIEITTKFSDAISLMVQNALEIQDREGIKSFSEEGRSITFSDKSDIMDITTGVKALLPKPFVRMW